MPLYLVGQLLDIARGESKDPKTGEINATVAAEILHKERGKSTIESLKFDPSVLAQWDGAKGKNVQIEVRQFAMKSSEGGVIAGLSLVDKKALPTILKAAA